MNASQAMSETYTCGTPAVASPHATPAKPNARPRLVAGPAAVMRNSAPGVAGSLSNCA